MLPGYRPSKLNSNGNAEPTVLCFFCKTHFKQNTWKVGPEVSGPLSQLKVLGTQVE